MWTVFLVPVCFVLVPGDSQYALETLLVGSEQFPSWWNHTWTHAQRHVPLQCGCEALQHSAPCACTVCAWDGDMPWTVKVLCRHRILEPEHFLWNESLDLSSLHYTMSQHKPVHKACYGSSALCSADSMAANGNGLTITVIAVISPLPAII